ncbi:glycine betaine ABC transporter substrate-binding protein [Corynebacterium accolens]|jgi:proline/glycine betaine ABC superfamily ATP binding cassette transporter, periplasmic component|uniref:Glycine betaine ABC transporter substrate-binding protein n=1 Tax=Corynebacterium accolens TaxID=38284 RepID=A0AAP4BZS1_9CORY|nr:glycine betaine ABC transporter substrate-binding protein [Corynebacterium accolens]EEI14370.1 ABC transporter, substrate-binding protein, QAT family [Corynebacterium accolens ATCC 49725]MDK4246954.1 glycine betaine ABC transporter substrate-binding protein [Corynebacterium accolens]MDK4279303.1 glycine betaine ABC transporter substrate-binding protein [Corynebacterium accolens]MDK4311651.1 glycine betaine ABC transporter substrate-binding protein [Corynebacterium accolens]MDK4322919.1 glyc
MKIRKTIAATSAAALALSLAACADNDSDSDASGSDGDKGTITLGYLPSWTDGLSTAYLLENKLEAAGYDVEHEELTDAAVLYAGLANGDIDIYPSAWSEKTHEQYMDKYSDDIEDLGSYYDNAVLTWAVPEYMEDINSIEDLKGKSADFNDTVVGIEPGAGLTEASKKAIEDYGLDEDGYNLSTSSTPAMLSELQTAVDNEDDIVVTLWRPFWANAKFPVKDLEDPKGSLGDPESLHWLARDGFSDEFPEVSEWLGDLKLDDEQYGSLEDNVVNQFEEGKEPDAVQDWLDKNPDVVKDID